MDPLAHLFARSAAARQIQPGSAHHERRLFMQTMLKRTVLGAAVAALMCAGLAIPAADVQAGQPRRERPVEKQPGKDAERKEKPKVEPARIGEAAPDFELKDLDGQPFKLAEQRGKIVVLEWFNPDCPFVVKHHERHKTMQETYERHKAEGVVWVAINSAAPGKQGYGKDRNEKARRDFELVYPLLFDESGNVGRAYSAKVTPHMYIIDREGVLVYAGAIDNDRSASKLGSINYVDQALREVIAGTAVSVTESQPYGCTVKYSN
jgi:peroxiredoxin